MATTHTAADSFATDSIREAVFSREALAFARYQRSVKAKRITGQVIAFLEHPLGERVFVLVDKTRQNRGQY
jgi:hypothetical protein